jgi:hypothetical protein
MQWNIRQEMWMWNAVVVGAHWAIELLSVVFRCPLALMWADTAGKQCRKSVAFWENVWFTVAKQNDEYNQRKGDIKNK